jgi:nucleoside-diphosphate-sugar epimerase
MKVLLTGASGFVGKAVCAGLDACGADPIVVCRASAVASSAVARYRKVYAGDDFNGLTQAVTEEFVVDAAIHLAARVHVMGETAASALPAYRETNVYGSLRVAEAALRAGARRFVYVSSIKALGDVEPGRPWHEDDIGAPHDPYGISKREAEEALFAFGRESGLDVVVVRAPLVYGPGVRANFLQLMQAVARGVPLPLGQATARRSLVFVDNLADALVRCALNAPRAAVAGRVLHVTDGVNLAVCDLVRMMGVALDRPARLLPVPASIMLLAGRLTGRSEQIMRLFSPLRLDTAASRAALDWNPPFDMERGLHDTARWYATAFPGKR